MTLDRARILMGGKHGWKTRLANCLDVRRETVYGWTELSGPVAAFITALSYVPAEDREHVIRVLGGDKPS